MAKVFISGSSTGLGLMTGRLLVEQGHEVVLHGRTAARSADARRELTQALDVVTGDLSTVRGAREVAEQVNRLGRFDAVIHNAGIGYREPKRVETQDGVPEVFATNVLASFVLTALIERPARLVYLSSGNAPRRRRQSGRPCLDAPALVGLHRLCRKQTLRRGPGFRRRPPLA